MRTYTFGKCIELLDIDAKVFRRWVREDLKLSDKDQKSKADSRVRYLTEEQLKQLAVLHEKALPPDDQLPDEKEEASPGAYKLLDDRLTTVEASYLQLERNVSTATGNLDTLLERVGKELPMLSEHITSLKSQLQIMPILEERLIALEAQIRSVPVLTEHIATLETQLSAIPIPATPLEAQRIADIEASYQERIKELEDKLAQYQQPKKPTSPLPSRKKPVRKKRSPIKALPATLTARNAFSALHNVSEKLVSKASLDGKIATTEGKWLSGNAIVTRALNTKGKHDFYQVFHERQGFQTCEQCPHEIQE